MNRGVIELNNTPPPPFSGDEDELLAMLLADEGFAAEADPIIPRRPTDVPPPLSFAQQRLWFLDQLEPGNPAYNIPTAVIHLTGRLDAPALAHSLQSLVKRHESLRTRFTLVDGRPVQEIGPVDCPLSVIDLRHLPAAEQPEQVRRLALAEACLSFDLARGPLLRTSLLRLAGDRHVLLLTMHHIVSDGWSMGVFYRELAHLYRAYVAGQSPSLPPLPLQYADFAVWQRDWLSGEALAKQLAYWRTQLAEAPPVLPLPLDHARSALSARHPGSVRHLFKLSPELSAGVEVLGQLEGATLFMTLLAAFQLLLFRYTRQTDISVGSPIANRNRQEIEGLIGFFVNTLVLRTDLSGAPTFRQLLQRVRRVALDGYAHQDLPFEKLVEILHPERDLSLTPFFQTMFVLQNAPMPPLHLPDLTMTIAEVESGAAKFDLILEMVQQPTGLSGSIEYDTSLFEPETIARMAGHFQTLLAAIVANPNQAIDDVPLLTAAEQRQLLVEWNQTRRDYPLAEGFVHFFEAQTRRTPEAAAVISEGRTLTYAQLNGLSNVLAYQLVDLGVGPETVVALLAERGIELLAMMLAVFKAGGAYLPLDPRHPPQRHRQILTQSAAPLVLAATEFLPTLMEALAGAAIAPRVLAVESMLDGAGDAPNLPARSGPDNLAYVIFTSGSTGQPKGAMVTQRGMLNHLWSKVEDLHLTGADVLAQNASQCFDISVWQFLAALLVGGQIHIFDDEVAHDPPALLTEVARRRITIFQLVPSMLRAIIQAATAVEPPDLTALRWVVPTGEALTTELCRQWLALYPGIPLLNAYGSTECSDDQCHHPIRYAPPPEYTLPTMLIGKAMPNVQLYILDKCLAPVPIGVAGEIYVGGIGVGRGYLNDPRRTAEVFIPDPFSPEPGQRLYKTGDLGRYRPDGAIEFLGRVDYMVKIRGFRIEMGEIEAALARHPAVREAVVLARTTAQKPDDKYLAAYVAPETWPGPSLGELRAFLKDHLPEYMVPAVFVPLEILPLTPNGKINRQALPEPETVGLTVSHDYRPPTNPVERVLVRIWGKVLGVERVSIDADFFQLGGHSLLATQLVYRVRAAFQIDLPLRDFFRASTVAELARLVEEIRWGRGGSIGSGIDLDAEAQLPDDIQPPAGMVKSTRNPSTIFLSGATGFLGAFLLSDLLRQTGAKIYCLVRAIDAERGWQRLVDSLARSGRWQPEFSGRIVPVVGDLAEPRLGLSWPEFDALADKVEVIYHNGALVNFVYPYRRLCPANVGGTLEVLRLATRRRSIPLHYVSTVSVFDSRPYFDGRTILETEEPGHAAGLLYGYAQTKWVAEKLVAEAGRRGLPVTIYRPGTVIGDSETGVWNNGDYLGRLISGCLQLGSFPALEQVLQMAPVDFVSRAIVYLSGQDAAGQVFHVVSPHKLKLRQLTGMLQKLGYDLSLLPYPEWQAKLIEAGTRNTLYAMLPLFVEWLAPDEPMTLVELLEREPEYDTRNLHAGLENSTIVSPALDPVLLKRYLSKID
jgi:amino acid adenylation domain-containing protein/thioester reductase-like protein